MSLELIVTKYGTAQQHFCSAVSLRFQAWKILGNIDKKYNTYELADSRIFING